ncbi:hypothetical protein OEA41_007014 [Lepraria neglecta]|uniref:Uncharacterized protein n=1 Tax=Lepraria neglecta TaxID=209136 RepID=A0AAE0DKS7_9LECA|nr:hypothetical protein OEA41_007014 [Lepraria neglecta]
MTTSIPARFTSRRTDRPGYTDSPPIMLLRITDRGVAYARGWTRLVDIDHFTAHSNKAELIMAEIVATVLYNHHPYTLDAFLNMETRPNFSFTRKDESSAVTVPLAEARIGHMTFRDTSGSTPSRLLGDGTPLRLHSPFSVPR